MVQKGSGIKSYWTTHISCDSGEGGGSSGKLRTVCEARRTAAQLKHLASAYHSFQSKLWANIKFHCKGRDGTGQGRAGQGRAGQGRAGQGRSMETALSVDAVYRAEDL